MNRKKERVQLTCATCQEVFLVIPSKSKAKFCSNKCKGIGSTNFNKHYIESTCELCNCKFQYTLNNTNKKNPPALCIRCKKNTEFNTNCSKCNKGFIRRKTAKAPYFCSNKCRITNILGKDFGDLKVIYREGKKVACQCKCGNIIYKKRYELKSDSKCKDCVKKNNTINISGQLVYFIKYYALKRGLSFNITKDYMLDLYQQQCGKCYYTGMDIKFAKDRRDEERKGRSASLDRINSKIGYEIGNIRWLHKDINLMKWHFSENDFLYYIKSIIEFPKSFIPIEYNKVNYNPNFRGVGDISGAYFTSVKKGASTRKLDFEINMDYVWDIYKSQGGVCYYSGIPIQFTPSYKRKNQTASIDRIDSSKGYINGNIVICHKNINLMKRHWSEYFFLILCQRIYDHMNLKECIIPSIDSNSPEILE